MKQLLLAIALSWSALLAAQDDPMAGMPGYVDFSSLNAIYGEPRVMVNIGGPLMQLMAAAAQASDDPEAAAMMRDLEGVRINIYDTGGNLEPALAQMQQAHQALAAADWMPIIQVKEQGENIQMYTRLEGDTMQGMAIMVVNAEEAVFLNILGAIDPSQVSRVMEQMNVDVGLDEE